MNVEFKFNLLDKVTTPHGIDGKIESLGVNVEGETKAFVCMESGDQFWFPEEKLKLTESA